VPRILVCAVLLAVPAFALGRRKPVLPQIDLPHSYYYREMYLPQMTSGPAAAAWSPDGKWLVYAMQGFLWRQRVDGAVAEQLTDSDGTDHQPDWSPDGARIVFVRYDGRAMELMLLDVATGAVTALTSGGAVNVEPRWSPDGTRLAWVSTVGTGHFLLHTAQVRDGRLAEIRTVVADHRSAVPRYYYSPFDHSTNPAWTPDGKSIVFVSNREVAHGTGDIVHLAADGSGSMEVLRREETNWQARPDVSPDGTRIVYASYLGGQWHQLWLLPLAGGGYPIPLTYGDFDNTNPRWSRDGRQIAFISNRTGTTSLWVVDAVSGEQRQVVARERRFFSPRRTLTVKVQDEAGRPLPARLSVTDARGRFFAPDDAWIHADDLLIPERQRMETRYVHGAGEWRISVPPGPLEIKVARGPGYAVVRRKVDGPASVTVTLPRLAFPGKWWSADLHVHMNYGGRCRNTPAHLVQQARAEGLDLVYNLVVNKEQRVPDIAAFLQGVDPASTGDVLLLHGEEFHSSYWGHIGLLGLQRLILPGYTAYPFTAVASPWPNNAAVADLAHAQGGLVGYVHPFDSDVDPSRDERLTNELVVDAALGKVDYYEAVGFSDHLSTAAVWYRLLDCGLRLPAGAGTDAMANYASLRGPVGLNRVYVKAHGELSRESFLAGLKAGRTFATNGPLVDLRVGTAGLGDSVEVPAGSELRYHASLRSNVSVAKLEVIWNGAVAARHDVNSASAEVTGRIDASDSGWMLVRAYSEEGNEDVLDIHPYATTSPIYVTVSGRPRRSRAAAAWALQWLDRLEKATVGHADYRTPAEREAVLHDISRAKVFYQSCFQGSEGHAR
jgi:TolB protein